jgi:hypothetical protein
LQSANSDHAWFPCHIEGWCTSYLPVRNYQMTVFYLCFNSTLWILQTRGTEWILQESCPPMDATDPLHHDEVCLLWEDCWASVQVRVNSCFLTFSMINKVYFQY